MNRIITLGSLNLDIVYQLPHPLICGETVQSLSRRVGPGGKGANQSVAAARAGVKTLHAGRIGRDGQMLIDVLQNAGADTSLVSVDPKNPSGHAVILVDDKGSNSIILHGGANQALDEDFVDTVIAAASPGDILLLQNEINPDALELAIHLGAASDLRVALNFAPIDPVLAEKLPLELLEFLFVNEIEAAGISGENEPEKAFQVLAKRCPEAMIVVTMGKDGVLAGRGGEMQKVAAFRVNAIDTTAAGDTFVGYFLAQTLKGDAVGKAVKTACAASALTVQRRGASESIPAFAEVAAAFDLSSF